MSDNGIQKGLEQDAQRIKERIPMDVTKATAEKTADSLRTLMSERQYSQADIARMLGISSAVISQFLAGKYKGNLEDLINKIDNLINSEDRRSRQTRGSQYVETTIAKKIGALIAHADAFSGEEGKIALIVGDSGCGKSCCLRAYAEANKNSIYIELDKAMHATMIFAAIAKKLRLDSSGSLSMVTQRVIDRLQNLHYIIILDESSSLNVSQLDLLRQIIAVKSRCPLILAGNGDLVKTIGLPQTKRGYESLDQFRSRLTRILDLNAMAGDKDGGLYTAEDIRKLYQYGGIRLADDAVKLLRKISRTPGTGRLRTCQHIIAALHTVSAVKEAQKIDAKLIMQAIEQLDLPVNLPVTIEESEPEETQQGAKVA
jgi:DNA transposition AAA+ family ATPase